jgi:predicted dithiol-disulfide oxidoreductase (DUF899 family)
VGRGKKGALAKEKEFTRLRDQLSRERRELPWELVEKEYTFEGERSAQTRRFCAGRCGFGRTVST